MVEVFLYEREEERGHFNKNILQIQVNCWTSICTVEHTNKQIIVASGRLHDLVQETRVTALSLLCLHIKEGKGKEGKPPLHNSPYTAQAGGQNSLTDELSLPIPLLD